ncbi:penicillin-binding transpeptidase domain-containing protein [Sphaerimonospora sp. CA-214678]|uniref:penicillin-binding transpeptidase domain-containing protein n=1 Tax=Sphaerimonospora sp. CA-214678 TaxID=3240029 RepID=UPI003D8B3B2F
MRNRALLALITVAATIFVSGVVGLIVSGGQNSTATQSPAGPAAPADESPPTLELLTEPDGSPRETADDYLEAWSRGDFEAMREMVDDPPGDFLARHRDFEDAVLSPARFTPETAVTTGGDTATSGDDTAEVPFTQERAVPGYGTWTIRSTLHLAVRDLAWKVVWTPAVVHPDLADGGQIVRVTTPAPPQGPVTREGRPFPKDSWAGDYLTRLSSVVSGGAGLPTEGTDAAWAIRLENPGQPARPLIEHRPRPPKQFKTTVEWATQAAAARALDEVGHPAALVAVRPSTGEILAVADRLGGTTPRGAFEHKYAPGSTFKTITAAALLNTGLTPDTAVECPAAYQIPNHRLIPNYHDEDHGTVTLRQAYALSCNTTFARLTIERLNADALVEQARLFGFGVPIDTGIGGTCGSLSHPENPDFLAEDSFGQGTVEATPLCMALVAAAVRSGEWRPPRLVDTPEPAAARLEAVPLQQGVADGLRTMMSAVVTEGTAAGDGLPEGTAGKTGTAEDWQGGPDHAWFIGYRGDVAFAVFVEHGGTGAGAAAPIAARFLRAL